MELLAFTNNFGLERVYYKGTSKSPLLFEIVLCLQRVQIKRGLLPHVVHIAVTSMIKNGIYGLSQGNNLGGMTRVLDSGLKPRLRSWSGENLMKMQPSDWFELQGDNFLWEPTLAAVEKVMELFLEVHMYHPYCSHLNVVPRLMEFLWRKQIGKEDYLLFTVIVGIPFWDLGVHEPLIIALFFPIISLRNWRRPRKIKVSEWASRIARALHIYFR